MAPADVVVIDLPSHHVEARAAVQSCALVLGEGQCRAQSDTGSVPTWHAVVVWEDAESLQARIEMKHANSAERSVQQRAFTPADSLSQRYSALGLVIVSHVVAANARRAQQAERAPASSLELGFDLGLQLGPSVQNGESRWGAILRGWAAPFALPLRPSVSVGWSAASGDVDATWVDAGLGLALHALRPTTLFEFELRLEGIGQRLLLHAERDGAAEQRWLSRYGARTSLEAYLGLTENFAVLMAGQASFLAPRYEVEVQGRPVGEERGPTWGALLGVRVSR